MAGVPPRDCDFVERAARRNGDSIRNEIPGQCAPQQSPDRSPPISSFLVLVNSMIGMGLIVELFAQVKDHNISVH